MAAIKLIVGDAAAPQTVDTYVKGLLEGLGHTVTLTSDETAEDLTGVDGIVISESCSTTTLGTKYNTAAVPLITHEAFYIDTLRLSSNEGGDSSGQTQMTVLDDTHPIMNGPFAALTGTVTLLSAGGNLPFGFSGTFGSGVSILAQQTSDSSHINVVAAESGATLASGTAPARRAFVTVPINSDVANVTADAEALIKNAYVWAFGSATYPEKQTSFYSRARSWR